MPFLECMKVVQKCNYEPKKLSTSMARFGIAHACSHRARAPARHPPTRALENSLFQTIAPTGQLDYMHFCKSGPVGFVITLWKQLSVFHTGLIYFLLNKTQLSLVWFDWFEGRNAGRQLEVGQTRGLIVSRLKSDRCTFSTFCQLL